MTGFLEGDQEKDNLVCHLCSKHFKDFIGKAIYEDGKIYCPKCVDFVNVLDKEGMDNS